MSIHQISLTKIEAERIAIFTQLNPAIEQIVVFQKGRSGIGQNTYARFYTKDGKYQEVDITDYGSW